MTAAEPLPPPPPSISSLLSPSTASREDGLAILYLRRDQLISTILQTHDREEKGYDEGNVINTRFGSFPHSTLVRQPWGSQVRASAVDTGTRGRKKRKLDTTAAAESTNGDSTSSLKTAVQAESGFVHILPPTPELWTASLPHRTQVVYTPDYSYILHRLRARPGTRIIEAGAGSGSFTHAAARAVYSGNAEKKEEGTGKVWSFEFHASRAEKLKQELREHGLDGLVELTCRDVCGEGFVPDRNEAEPEAKQDGNNDAITDTRSPRTSRIKATAVFLDLPAPWLALPHLSHSSSVSPLSTTAAVHLCTFSPCIEQVTRTVSTLREQGWVEIEMIELAAKKIEVRRERVGVIEAGLRGVDDSPASVEEAVGQLREVEQRTRVFHREAKEQAALNVRGEENEEERKQQAEKEKTAAQLKRDAQELLRQRQADRALHHPLFRAGRLVTRDEAERKMHTSYLVFAVLPRPWTEEDEEQAGLRAGGGL